MVGEKSKKKQKYLHSNNGILSLDKGEPICIQDRYGLNGEV